MYSECPRRVLDFKAEWIITAKHWPKSEQNGSMAALTAPRSDILAA